MSLELNNQPWPVFSEDEIELVSSILRSGKVNYWTGDQGKIFEKEFAEYLGVNYAIALANGTLALELALNILGISKGDEVIVPSRTYIATASAVALNDAIPVVADVERDSGNISAATIEKVRTSRTKAIIVVHLAGWPCDMNSIMSYAKEHNLLVIEDCAQAHGASISGKKVGSFGDAAAFSFCQDKIMTTCGEGGMVTFNDRDKWYQAWSFKDHGKDYDTVFHKDHSPGFRWLVSSFGSNYRMTEMQSAVGRYQLEKLDEWISIRQRNAKILHKAFEGIPLVRLPVPPEGFNHACYKYYIYLNPHRLSKDYTRDKVMKELNENGIPCFSGTCSEIYLEQAFQESNLGPEQRLAISKELGETSLMFLVDPTFSENDMRQISEVTRKIFLNAGD